MADKTINQLTEDTSPTVDDYIPAWDAGAGASKKVTIANIGTPIASQLGLGKFVPVEPGVVLVDIDPPNTTYVAVDCTANTHANCYAVLLQIGTQSATTVGRHTHVRKTGNLDPADNTTIVNTNQVLNTKIWSMIAVGVDSSQSFDYAASNADINAITIVLRGYYRTI